MLLTSIGTEMKLASSAMGPWSAPRDAKMNRHVRPALTPACAQIPEGEVVVCAVVSLVHGISSSKRSTM